MLNTRTPAGRLVGAFTLGLLVAAATIAASPSPASAAPSFSQKVRCDGDAAFDDLTIDNPDAPMAVDVRVAGSIVINNLDLPTGKTTATLPYLPPPPAGAMVDIVEQGTDTTLASAPMAARPECGDASITIANSSRCVGDELKLVITVANGGPGSYAIKVVFGGGTVLADNLSLPEGASKELVMKFPTDLTPENQQLATIEVQNAANGERLAFKQMDAQGQHCTPVTQPTTPTTPPGTRTPPPAAHPAAPQTGKPSYTG